MLLLPRDSHFRFVKPDRDEISEMLLLLSRSSFRSVKPDNDEISEMLLVLRFRIVRLVANCSPVKSPMRASFA